MIDELEGNKKREKVHQGQFEHLVLCSKRQQKIDLIAGDRQREWKSRGDKTQ